MPQPAWIFSVVSKALSFFYFFLNVLINKHCPAEREDKIMFTHTQTIWHRKVFVVLLDLHKLASNRQSFV